MQKIRRNDKRQQRQELQANLEAVQTLTEIHDLFQKPQLNYRKSENTFIRKNVIVTWPLPQAAIKGRI